MRPSIKWKVRIGSIQSRNNIVLQGGDLFVGTCGSDWNKRDAKDAVHSIDPTTGAVRWSVPTTADVNEIAVASETVLAPTDAGDLFIIDRKEGRVRTIHRLDSAVVSKPLVFEQFGRWTALVITLSGYAYLVDSIDEADVFLGPVGGRVRANILPVPSPGNTEFLCFTENGQILRCSYLQGQLDTHILGAVLYTGYNDKTYAIDTLKRGVISGTPILDDGSLFGGFARETEFNSLPMYRFDLESESFRWLNPEALSEGFGNCRVTPCVVKDKVVISLAYSNGLQVLNREDGSLAGSVRLGQTVFQQWSSPTPFGEGEVVIGRVDGVLSLVDIASFSLISSVSLATAEIEQLSRESRFSSDETDTFALYPGEPPQGGICGTPLVDGRSVFVGTTSGDLFCVDF